MKPPARTPAWCWSPARVGGGWQAWMLQDNGSSGGRTGEAERQKDSRRGDWSHPCISRGNAQATPKEGKTGNERG